MQHYCFSGEHEHLTLFRHAHQQRRKRVRMIRRVARAATWLLVVTFVTSITWIL
jgi:hypothetical protein